MTDRRVRCAIALAAVMMLTMAWPLTLAGLERVGHLVGATFVGQDVADLLHSATIAVVGEVPLTRLRHAVPSFPTISEVWLRLLEEYGM